MSTQPPMTVPLRRTARQPHPLFPLVQFTVANMKGMLRNWLMMGITLFTPMLLLLMFWATSKEATPEPGQVDLLAFMFPGLVAFTIIQTGGPHAVTIVNWREQGIFRRLACTPIPLWQLVLARSLAQLAVSLVQGALMVAFGVLLLGLPISWGGLLLAFVVLAAASACFIALGSVIAGLCRNALLTNAIYIFIVIPMLFLGDFLMPTGVLPSSLQVVGIVLPPALVTALIRPLMITGGLPTDAWVSVLALAGYSVVFVLLSIKVFRWQ